MSERNYFKTTDGTTQVTNLNIMYDGVANITRFYHEKTGGTVVVGFQYDHDKMANPQYKLREHQSNYGDEYMYDKLYRLTRTVYDDSTPATPTSSPAATVTDAFGYDSIGNRANCYLKSATVTSYLHNSVNEYTKESTGGTDKYYGHDAAGNLTRVAAAQATDTDGDWRYYYDYENQMTKAEKRESGAWATKAEYARDALMRRIEKVVAGTTMRYYHDGRRAIEETEGTDTPTVERQYVFGNGIDEALVLFKKNGANYDPYYYLADRLWTVEALVNDAGTVVEAYSYRAYGEPTIKTGAGNDGMWFTSDDATSSASAYGNTVLFAGRNWDEALSIYYQRFRQYDSIDGRLTNWDPLNYAEGMCLYEYGNSRPTVLTDPFGLEAYKSDPNLKPDDKFLAEMGDCVAKEAGKIADAGTKMDCADVALTALSSCAAEKKLRLQVPVWNAKDKKWDYLDSDSAKYKDLASFQNDLQSQMGAGNLWDRDKVTKPREIEKLAPGDLILFNLQYQHNPAYAGHTMIVTKNDSTAKTVGVVEGHLSKPVERSQYPWDALPTLNGWQGPIDGKGRQWNWKSICPACAAQQR